MKYPDNINELINDVLDFCESTNRLTLDQIEATLGYIDMQDIEKRLSLSKYRPFDEKRVIDIMLHENIIVKGDHGYIVTERGKTIREKGGWTKYVQRKRNNKIKNKRDKKLSREVNKAVKWASNTQIIAAVFTTIIIGYNLWIDKKNYDLNVLNREESIRRDSLQQIELKHFQQKLLLFVSDSSDHFLSNKGTNP